MKILGIDLGGTNVRVGLIDGYSLINVASTPISTKASEEKVLEEIFALIDQLITHEVAGIGIGVPSVVDLSRGIVYDVQNIPSWKEVHLKEIMEKRYGIPVYINNDANCFAAGEKYFGKAKDYQNAVGLIVGTGLGAGIIVQGRLYSGSNCGAGEFGMIPYRDNILEYYCSGQFFSNEFSMTGEEVFTKAMGGDENALEIFSRFGKHLGEAIKIILYTYDPEVIILGGSVSKSYRFFEESMKNSISDFAYAQSLKNIKIETSELDQVALLGAAALYFDAVEGK